MDKRWNASVIIISYNEAELLPRAIDSVLALEGEDTEIIVGDDGSDDGSIDILKAYALKYPDCFRYYVMDRSDTIDLIPSLRVSNSIKRGVSMARGSYIALLSGDDFFCETKMLSEASAFLNAHPKYIAYVNEFYYLWPDGRKELASSALPQVLSWSDMYIHISAFVFRRTVFDDGFFLDRFCDDTGLVYSLIGAGKWKYSGKPAFCYYQRGGSIVHDARKLELQLTELLLLQDICNKKRVCSNSVKNFFLRPVLLAISAAHFATPLYDVFVRRKELKDCGKYLRCAARYDNDFLSAMAEYDRLPLAKRCWVRWWLLLSKDCFFFYYLGKACQRLQKQGKASNK